MNLISGAKFFSNKMLFANPISGVEFFSKEGGGQETKLLNTVSINTSEAKAEINNSKNSEIRSEGG